MDYSRFTTKKAGRRKPDLIRRTTTIFTANPELITMAGGFPNIVTFPFEEIEVTYKDGTGHTLAGNDLEAALQYGPTIGYTPLLKLWREFQNRWHSPPRDDWELVVTTGAQEGCSKIFELFIEEGDPVMIQTPTFTGTLAALHDFSPEFIGIEQDADGIIPERIQEVCEERKQKSLPQPKFLLVNPTGANPTGSVLAEERRRRVYALAQEYDFLILEDDPYYFVHFLDYRPTSFFSMDTDGRVIRLDSFSKVLSAGFRIGIVTAHKDIVKSLILHMETSTLHTSALSQVLIYKLLDSWGPEKFEEHLTGVRNFYRQKRDVMVSLVEKHLSGLAEWSTPKGGMFLWIKVKGVDDVFDLVMEQFTAKGVLVLPGNAFHYDAEAPDQNLRLCYSYASPQDIDEGLSIIAGRIRETIVIRNNGAE